MSINSNDYRVPLDKKVDLGKWPTTIDPYYKSTKQYQELLERHMQKLSSLQQLHFASHRYALLLIFQGMDGAGKDGAIRHVMSGVNPEGCEVFNFKQPSAEELDHDFLWRTTSRLPERGRIGIFNRSFYEEVLVVRVHPEILRDQGLPKELLDEKNIWDHRYTSIVDLEKHLHRNGTRTIKIFLHLPMRNSEGDSWRASTSQTRTGSSVRRTFMRGSIGNATGRPTRIASTRQALIMRPGTSFRPTTRSMHG
jgi:polyphosphate kinase 2 (PPK2 family)